MKFILTHETRFDGGSRVTKTEHDSLEEAKIIGQKIIELDRQALVSIVDAPEAPLHLLIQ